MTAEKQTFLNDLTTLEPSTIAIAMTLGGGGGMVAGFMLDNEIQHIASANQVQASVNHIETQQTVIKQLEDAPGAQGNPTVQAFLRQQSEANTASLNTLHSAANSTNLYETIGTGMGGALAGALAVACCVTGAKRFWQNRRNRQSREFPPLTSVR